MLRRLSALGLLLSLLGLPAAAAEARDPVNPGITQGRFLAWPVACRLNQDCFILNHVDTDPGPGHRDLSCGARSYQGHDGLDIAIAGRARMREGVAVLAPAAGIVIGLRDGEPDSGTPSPGRDCGNGIRLDHGGARQTQLCHLREGSIRVRLGEEVRPGQPLALIGQSGNADWPHLHLAVEVAGIRLDPMTGLPPGSGRCDPGGADTAGTLFLLPPEDRRAHIAWAAILPQEPDPDLERASPTPPQSLPLSSPVLVAAANAFGVEAGDRMQIRLLDPSGQERAGRTLVLDRPRARQSLWAGIRLRPQTRSPGTWQMQVEIRDAAGRSLSRQSAAVTLRE